MTLQTLDIIMARAPFDCLIKGGQEGETCESVIKELDYNDIVPPVTKAAVAAFIVTPLTQSDGSIWWKLSLPADGLPKGRYVFNAAIKVAGTLVARTENVRLIVEESTTP